jgi:hypothetical protein
MNVKENISTQRCWDERNTLMLNVDNNLDCV